MPTIRGKFFEQRQPLVRVRLSNAIPQIDGDEVSYGPAAQRGVDVWALIDTGATTSVIDIQMQRELTLPQQGSKPVLFPNMERTEYHPTYTCALHFFEHYSEGSRLQEWKDWPEVLAFSLTERTFRVVIGMDILAGVHLWVRSGIPTLEF